MVYPTPHKALGAALSCTVCRARRVLRMECPRGVATRGVATWRGSEMKIAIMGAGAVGGYYGGVLARFGEDVTLICRGAHLDAIARDGLKLSTHSGEFTVRPGATADPSEVGRADLILYTVKTYSNPTVLPLIEPMVGTQTVILTVQNGVSSGATIAQRYGWDRVLPGATYIEAGLTAPGRIEQAGPTALIEFGERSGEITSRVDEIALVLSKEGIQVETSKDIEASLWSKMVSVAAIGTIMTVARASLAEILSGPWGELTLRSVMDEVFAVGRAAGVAIPAGIVDDKMRTAIAEAEEYKSSLQLDLEMGRPLEIDDIIGAVVSHGQTHGVPTPASAALYTALSKFKTGRPDS